MLRKAKLKDIKEIQALVNYFAKKDLMLQRSLFELCESVRDFWVFEHKEKIIGCCALRMTWQDLAEIRSLAVNIRYHNKRIGEQMVNAAIEEARQLGNRAVFVLTYVPEYFKKFGFRNFNKENLPHKIWAECINCSKFPDCKEVALIKKL